MGTKNVNPDRPLYRIHEDYLQLNNKMAAELEMSINHSGITGSAREGMWMTLFRQLIPKKFALVKNILIIDSEGKSSNEVDIAAIDEQYTPYVFQYNDLKLVPIEAVAVVIECKSCTVKNREVKEWAEKIEALNTNPYGLARMVGGMTLGITNKTQQKTRPIIICANLDTSEHDVYSKFDFVIKYEKPKKGVNPKFIVQAKNDPETLGWWHRELNGIAHTDPDEGCLIDFHNTEPDEKARELLDLAKKQNANKSEWYLTNKLEDLRIEGNDFLSLNLQLNQLLMLINNPMLFPHFAYAKIFKEIISEGACTQKENGK